MNKSNLLKFRLTNEDLENSEQIKKKLILIIHAYKCLMRRVAIANGSPIKQHTEECKLDECENTKKVLQHMKACRKAEKCVIDNCWNTRRIVSHYRYCKDNNCCICVSVRSTLEPKKSISKSTPKKTIPSPSKRMASPIPDVSSPSKKQISPGKESKSDDKNQINLTKNLLPIKVEKDNPTFTNGEILKPVKKSINEKELIPVPKELCPVEQFLTSPIRPRTRSTNRAIFSSTSVFSPPKTRSVRRTLFSASTLLSPSKLYYSPEKNCPTPNNPPCSPIKAYVSPVKTTAYLSPVKTINNAASPIKTFASPRRALFSPVKSLNSPTESLSSSLKNTNFSSPIKTLSSPVKSSSSIFSQAHPDIKKNFGHPIPKHFDNLVHLFTTLENVVFVKHERCLKISFENVSKSVMKTTKMVFDEKNLAQIIGVYSNSYKLRWEQRRQQAGKFAKTVFELILEPNFVDDLHPFYTESNISLSTACRKTARKMIFRHLLVMKVKDAHSTFLQKNNKSLASKDLLHPEFDLDSVNELPLGKIPDMPKSATPLRLAIDYFKAMPQQSEEIKKNDEKFIEENLLKSPTKTTNASLFFKSQTPKMSLLERIRAREEARKTIDKSKHIELENRRDLLHLLKKSMAEVICSHFTLKKVHGMNLKHLMPLVMLACGQLDSDKFYEHIDALCEAAPNFCQKEILNTETFLKINEVRVDKIQNCIDERIECIELELRKLN